MSARSRRRTLFWRIVALLIITALLLVGGSLIKITELEAASEQDWAATFGSLDARLSRYPQQSANRGAIAVHRVGLELGLRLLPALDPPEAVAVQTLLEVEDELHLYVYERAALTERSTLKLPSTLSSYFELHGETLGRLVETVHAEAPILWARDNERLFGPPLNHNGSQRRVARLLLASFYRQLDAGDREAALSSLDALWKIHEGTRGNLGLGGWMTQLENLQLLAGALRQLPQPPSVWRERIDPQSQRELLLDTFRHYGWLWSQVDDVMRWDRNVNLGRRLLGAAAAPYAQLCDIDTSARYKRGLQNLIDLDYLCDRDLVAAGVPRDWKIPWWNKMGGNVAHNVTDLLERWRRAELDLEMTLLLLEWEALGSAPPEQPSQVCPDGSWIYSKVEGGAELRFSRELRWLEPQRHVALPSRFRLGSAP